jgi:hypothetical protein
MKVLARKTANARTSHFGLAEQTVAIIFFNPKRLMSKIIISTVMNAFKKVKRIFLFLTTIAPPVNFNHGFRSWMRRSSCGIHDKNRS